MPFSKASMDMSKDYRAGVGYEKPTGRITRPRATACRGTGDMLPLLPPPLKSDHITQRNSKREAMDRYIDAALPVASGYKRRTVFKDITNKRCDNSHTKCIDAAKKRSKNSQKAELIPSKATLGISKKDSTLESAVSVENALPEEGARIMMDEQIRAGGVFKSKQTTVSVTLEEDYRAQHNIQDRESTGVAAQLDKFSFREALKITCHSRNVNDNNSNDEKSLTDRDYIDIDSDHNNPQMCSLYSPDIYTNLLAAELNRRPCSNFMETMQGDITQSMRGILIDWLVEVSEEYKLVPDTLYLTVYIIDQFLSGNYIERQRLQLLGITCMLIASKYEEICAPHVEELCFITDNTYTKEDVLHMERQILNFLGFQLSVPTIKTFLRRFLRAAQASYKVPELSLEFLANYLAELTLIEYNFLKFLPSIIAASSVFLARWTLDQSSKPWNLTLEYYTSYKASDLKATVLAMQDLRINVKNCPLNAVREKYRQLKFKSVETLPSQTLLPTLFCDTLPILPQSECC